MMWLQPQNKRWYADFLKVPLTKMKGENPKISRNFTFNRNLLSAIARYVERK